MTPEQLNDIRAAVREEIRSTVNGKIDALSKKLDDHIVLMAPVKDALNWVNTTQKFIKWTGIPVVVLIVWLMGWVK